MDMLQWQAGLLLNLAVQEAGLLLLFGLQAGEEVNSAKAREDIAARAVLGVLNRFRAVGCKDFADQVTDDLTKSVIDSLVKYTPPIGKTA